MMLHLPVALIGVFLLCACSGIGADGDRSPVPRPRAFARIDLYDTVYNCTDSLPVRFDTNAQAHVSVMRRTAGNVWLDVGYPAYGGVLHVSFTQVSDTAVRRQVIDNRTERMALNLGDNTAEQITVSSPDGFDSSILMATTATPMPVQFLSVGRRWVVSGAFTFDRSPGSADSIRPVVEAVTADAVRAAMKLKQL